MNVRVAKRLHDALVAAQRIDRYVQGRTYDAYVADDYFRSAVERQFEVISEALRIAVATDDGDEILAAIPQVPKIIGLRNRIAHSYDVLDDEIIWRAAVVEIPTLLPQLEEVLGDFDLPADFSD